MNQDQVQTDLVKGSSLGLILGILVVVAITMLVLNTSFVQEKLGKKSEETVSDESGGGFEIIDEPEITLLDEVEMEEIEKITDSQVDTHEPVDTALGDLNITLVSTMLLSGSGLMLLASKKIAG